MKQNWFAGSAALVFSAACGDTAIESKSRCLYDGPSIFRIGTNRGATGVWNGLRGAAFALPDIEAWQGPISSAFGVHLIQTGRGHARIFAKVWRASSRSRSRLVR